jgi:hypothetical protein
MLLLFTTTFNGSTEIQQRNDSVLNSYSIAELDKQESCDGNDKQNMHQKPYCHGARRNEEGNPCTLYIGTHQSSWVISARKAEFNHPKHCNVPQRAPAARNHMLELNL